MSESQTVIEAKQEEWVLRNRLAQIVRRSTDRGMQSANSRSCRVYTVLSEAERQSFDQLRQLIGMNRSQAARYLILKEIAFAMGRHRQGRTSVCVGRREG